LLILAWQIPPRACFFERRAAPHPISRAPSGSQELGQVREIDTLQHEPQNRALPAQKCIIRA